jgi:hypothetical protein
LQRSEVVASESQIMQEVLSAVLEVLMNPIKKPVRRRGIGDHVRPDIGEFPEDAFNLPRAAEDTVVSLF